MGSCGSTPAPDKEQALPKDTARSDQRDLKHRRSLDNLYHTPTVKERTDALLTKFMFLCAAVSVMALAIIITGAVIHRSWHELRQGYKCEKAIVANAQEALDCDPDLVFPKRTGDEIFQSLEGSPGMVAAIFTGASVLFLLGLGGAGSAHVRSVPGVAAVTAVLGVCLLLQLFLATALIESGTAYWTDDSHTGVCAEQLAAHVAKASASCEAEYASSIAAAVAECGRGTKEDLIDLGDNMVCTEEAQGCSCRCKPLLWALCKASKPITALGAVFAVSTVASFFAVSFGSMLCCSPRNSEEMRANAAVSKSSAAARKS